MLRNILLSLSRNNFQMVVVRNKQKKVPKIDKKFQAAAESLAARGFLRPNKPWDPPANIEETVLKICMGNGLKANSQFEALDIKFVVLNACFKETGYSVPNSLLHTIECVDDLMEFYKTPVDVSTPFEALLKKELPKNLHIQQSYARFHPDTVTLFNGQTAFPKSSTIVTGLKYKKKYPGHAAKRSWP